MSDSSFLGDMYICIHKCTVHKISMYVYIFCSYKQTEKENQNEVLGYKAI